MTKTIKPANPSKKDYLNLSKEFNRKWLFYGKYKRYLWYQEHYGPILDKKNSLSNNYQKNGWNNQNKHT